MSIFATAPIIPRLWRGYDDPGLPVGNYISHQVVVGDLSGGVMEIQFQFKTTGSGGSGRLFNVEQINVHRTVASSLTGYFKAVGWESVSGFVVGERIWPMSLIAISIDGTAAADALSLPRYPLFLGQTRQEVAINSDFEVATVNTNTIVLQAVIQGYIWEPRSIMAQGGLRRPLEALYGR